MSFVTLRVAWWNSRSKTLFIVCKDIVPRNGRVGMLIIEHDIQIFPIAEHI